ADRRAFGIDDVARTITEKLVRRHPHVFADGDASTPDEVQRNWDELKAEEKDRSGPFDGVPAAGPGLHLLETIQRKAAKRGFDWRGADDALDRLRVAIDELADAPPDARGQLLGTVLSRLVGLARHLDLD